MYEKTLKKFEAAKSSQNREEINRLFDSFFRKYHKENISYLSQRAYSQFGKQVTTEMIEDTVFEIYFKMLIMPEEQLLQMNETDLIKIFRSIVLGPAFTGAMYQQVKYASHEDIDDYE